MMLMVLAILLTGTGPVLSASLEIRVPNLRSDQGNLVCAVFASPDGFPGHGKKARYHQTAPVKDKEGICRFDAVEPGRYGITFMHDEDKNGKMKRNFIGLPREGWGVSRDAPPRTFGPPKFEDVAVDVLGDEVLTLKIRYGL